jgi:hypothetical protein
MGRCGVDEDTDQNVYNDDKAPCAKESSYKIHLTPLSLWALELRRDPAVGKDLAASRAYSAPYPHNRDIA